ncbi:MAG: EAL domain-containing protein, partial [Oscillospiraceae bacterium]|nr:EAL domain-containing protein [Oscillospiraceae bacterium]
MERKYTVLIVDDSEKNIEMISEMLSDSYELITAANGIDALEVMRGERCPDVVLLDMLMSKLDGYDILHIMSEDETLRFIPVIAITFDSDPNACARAFKLGAVDFLSCSEDIGIIQYRVRSVLRLCEMNKMRSEITSERRLSELMDNLPGGVALSERGSDGKLRMVFVSRGLADMLGFSSIDDCLAMFSDRPFFGVSGDDASILRGLVAEIPKTGGSFKYAFRYNPNEDTDLWLSMHCRLIYGDGDRLKLCAFITNVTKEKHDEDELRSSAYFDSLTGLYNRHAFIKNARRVMDEDPLTQFSIMMLNIGSFKVVNDLFGRDVGDKVLKIIANAVRELVADKGVYARFFSDNFVVLTPDNECGVNPQTMLDAVQKAVAQSGLLSHEIEYYIGVYTVADRSMSVESMADRAAIACRSINGSYQEHIAFYDEKMRLALLEEQALCDDSRRAIHDGEFCVYYQPVYGIKAKKFVSAEALVRWNHPTKGMISPGKFVPVFEKNGFIAELDLYVLEQVCIYMKRRRDSGLPQFPISVNISRMSLYDPKLYDTISELTDRYEIDPKFFRIEITESAYNDNPAQLLETVGKLRGKCYPVLMDDFGSGYSSLNTLKDIPIDILKLDMKFMQGFEKNGKVGTIVTSVARMSKWLNIPLLAEGVETKAQFDFLSSVGCAYIQGFYFARPVPEEELTRLIALEGVSGSADIETYALGDDVNELLGSNALVSKLISGAFGGFGIYEMYDNKLEALRVNNGYMKIMGYTPEDFNEENVNVWDMMTPEDAERSRNACLEALRTDEAVRAVVRRYDKNGNLRYLDGVHRRLGGTYENPILCIAFNDITDQRESERKLQLAYNEIEEIINATDSV